jgi:hypothetical protein
VSGVRELQLAVLLRPLPDNAALAPAPPVVPLAEW